MEILKKQQEQLEIQLETLHNEFIELSKKLEKTDPFLNDNKTSNPIYDKLRNDIIEKSNLYQSHFKTLYSIKAMELQAKKELK